MFKLFTAHGCLADWDGGGGGGEWLKSSLHSTSQALCSVQEYVSSKGGAVFCNSAKALYVLAGSPQQGNLSLSSAYTCIISQGLVARVDSRKAEVKAGLWAGVRKCSPWRSSGCQEGLATPMPPSWFPKQQGYPSSGLSSAFPDLLAYARSRFQVLRAAWAFLYNSMLHFAVMCVGNLICLRLPY